ncbi:MAG: hypothetical protein U1A78_26660 [Polyangia bacterium]
MRDELYNNLRMMQAQYAQERSALGVFAGGLLGFLLAWWDRDKIAQDKLTNRVSTLEGQVGNINTTLGTGNGTVITQPAAPTVDYHRDSTNLTYTVPSGVTLTAINVGTGNNPSVNTDAVSHWILTNNSGGNISTAALRLNFGREYKGAAGTSLAPVVQAIPRGGSAVVPVPVTVTSTYVIFDLSPALGNGAATSFDVVVIPST